jgi:hypothetical protein
VKLHDAAGYRLSSSSLSLIFTEEKAPYGKVVHPWPGRIYHLHVVLGAEGEDCKAELIHHSWTNAGVGGHNFNTAHTASTNFSHRRLPKGVEVSRHIYMPIFITDFMK